MCKRMCVYVYLGVDVDVDGCQDVFGHAYVHVYMHMSMHMYMHMCMSHIHTERFRGGGCVTPSGLRSKGHVISSELPM